MKEIKYRVLGLRVGLISIRSIDGKTAVDAEDLAVIPRMAYSASLLCGLVVLSALSIDQEHAEIT